MKNEMYGLCKQCVGTFISVERKFKDTECELCTKNAPEVIYNDMAICCNCYLMSTPKRKVTNNRSIMNTSMSQSVVSPALKKIDRGQINRSLFNSSGKLLKKVEKLFSGSIHEIMNALGKKAYLQIDVPWSKFNTKFERGSGNIYVYAMKNLIIGAFHSEIGNNTVMEDSECGMFTTERSNIKLNFYKVHKNVIKYDAANKSIIFGFPTCLKFCFDKEITVSGDLLIDYPSPTGIFYLLKY